MPPVLKINAHVRMGMVQLVPNVLSTTKRSVLRVARGFIYPVMNVFKNNVIALTVSSQQMHRVQPADLPNVDHVIPDTYYLVIHVLKNNAHVRMVLVQQVPIVLPTTRRSVLPVSTGFIYPAILVFKTNALA